MIGEKKDENSLIKFTGRPIEPDKPDELTRWQKFLKFIWPWAKKGGQLIRTAKEISEAYYSAEVAIKQSEAGKFAAEAENIAADTDLKRQEKVKIVNEEISRIFSGDDIPDAAKKLQLANLLANNPEIYDQLQKIEYLVTKMKTVNFTEFELDLENKVENKNLKEKNDD